MDWVESVESERLVEEPSTFGTFTIAHHIDIILWDENNDHHFDHGTCDREPDVLRWLGEDFRDVSSLRGANKTSLSWLRFLFFPHPMKSGSSVFPLPLSKSLYTAVATQLNLSGSFLQILESGMATFLISPDVSSGDQWHCRRFVFQENSFSASPASIALTYQASGNKTYIVMFGDENWGHADLCQYLRKYYKMIMIPTLVPVLRKEIMARHWNIYVDACHEEVFQVELATKMRKGLTKDTYIMMENDQVPDLKSIDLMEITRSLNSISAKLAYSSMQLRTSLRLLEAMTKINQDFKTNMGDDAHVNRSPGWKAQQLIEAKIQHLQSWYEGIDARCSYLTQRVQAQVQTVYNLVAQRDNSINVEISQASRRIAEASRLDNIAMREIAEDSKMVALAAAKDSSEMRVIANVTVIFLPATFTATLFSTSFFDFHPRQPSSVVSNWIWLYCTVTFVLTISIQALWFVYARRKAKQIAKKIERRSTTGIMGSKLPEQESKK